jgi:hypothetical protein
MTIWNELGFRQSLYAVDPVPASAEGEELLVGRNLELEQLRMYLTSSVTHPTIEGPNGVGKSSLVAVAGYQTKRAFEQGESNGQLLIPLRERFQITSGETAEGFLRKVYFAVAQAFIDNRELIASRGGEVPDTDDVNRWLNSPIFGSIEGGVSVVGTGGSFGHGSTPNDAAGFSEAGFVAAVERWLADAFPVRESGGFICVLDNLELLETVSGARALLEGLRDSVFNRIGLRWVLCGARGIVRGAASSSRLQGVLSDPMELAPISDDRVQEVVARRIDVFRVDPEAYVPVEPEGFRHLYDVSNQNLRNALKYCEDFALWQQTQKQFPEDPKDKLELLEAWMAVTADQYMAATKGVGDRGWQVFDGIVDLGGSVSPSDYEIFGFNTTQAFRGQVKALEEAQLVESSVDDSDERRRLIEVTSRGWIVRYQRAGYELPNLGNA